MKKDKISNPLTIVGIFAGIAEVAGTTVIPFITQELQSIFIWYVMGFPIILVLLFFITWNFNPRVLYSPSDYKNEENFLAILTKKYSSDVEQNLDDLEVMLTNVKKEIINSTQNALESQKTVTPALLENIVETKMQSINEKLLETKSNATELVNFSNPITVSLLEKSVISVIKENKEISFSDLAHETGMTPTTVANIINKLFALGLVNMKLDGKRRIISLNQTVD